MVRFAYFAVFAMGILFVLLCNTAVAQQNPDDLLLQFQQRLQSEAQDFGLQGGENSERQERSAQDNRGKASGQEQSDFRPASTIELSYRERLLRLEGHPGASSTTTSPAQNKSGRETDFISRHQLSGKWSFELKQIGYDALYQLNAPKLTGAVSDHYILGVGDKISVTLRGQVNSTTQVPVNRNGQVILPNLAPLNAAGRSFGDFRSDIEAMVASSMIETNAFVTLGEVRQLSVLVSGEVESPGLVSVTGLSSVVDALIAARGVKKTGSLRSIQVVRDGQTQKLDLYPLLLGFGEPGDLGLKEGDRIIVPAIGPTVAIFAAVSRPGIYELRGGSLSIRDGLMLAGGPLTAQGQRLLKLSVGPDGRETVTEQNASRGSLKRGDLLGVLPRSQGTAGAFYLSGHVYTEGWQSLNSTPGLRELLSNNSIMRNGPYLPFVVIKRFSPYNQSPEFIGVGGSLLLRSGADFPLQDQDQVIILSHDDIRYLSSEDVRLVMAGLAPIYGRTTPFKEALNERSFGQGGFRQGGQNNQTNQDNQSNQNNQNNQNGQTDQSGQNSLSQNGFRSRPDAIASMQVCEGLRSLASQVVERGMASHVDQPSSDGMLQNILPCPKLFDQYPSLLPFLIQNVMSLNGAVYRPGLYPVTDDGVLVDILSAAGGPLNTADPNKVEVTALRKGTAIRQQISLALAQTDYQIGPQSSVTVAEQFSNMDKGSVFLKGEVRYPGRYTLLRGERLSQVIERAGGFTEEAYVLGAVFQRQSIRDEEQKNYVRMARELEASMPNAFQKMAATSQGNIDGSLAVMQQAVHSLQSAVASGRMVIAADPASIQASPEADIILHPGDMLYVPKRPSHVMVMGEVMHTGAQQFSSGLPADEYIRRAGGFRDGADESRTYVILPNGAAKPLQMSSWNYSETQIPPGSTIIVPADLSPLVAWGLARDSLSIFSSLAISAAALATIRD